MKIVRLPKGKGKTTELLLWLLEGHAKGIDRALVVTTQQKRAALSKRLFELYNQNDGPQYINNAANRIYTVEAVKKTTMRNIPRFHDCEIGIDDADQILMFLLGIDRFPSIISVTDHESGTNEPEKSVIF